MHSFYVVITHTSAHNARTHARHHSLDIVQRQLTKLMMSDAELDCKVIKYRSMEPDMATTDLYQMVETIIL